MPIEENQIIEYRLVSSHLIHLEGWDEVELLLFQKTTNLQTYLPRVFRKEKFILVDSNEKECVSSIKVEDGFCWGVDDEIRALNDTDAYNQVLTAIKHRFLIE